MSNELENKVALVTGGSRGIGAAIAKRLAANGAHVAITYARDADAAARTIKAIERAGGKAVAIKADATDPAAVKAAVDKAVTSLGKLDISSTMPARPFRNHSRKPRWKNLIR
jgi:3-oxoacyl-[acyl-carrier protein] reductase